MFEKRYTLLRTQKRRVYEILRKTGLEPADFGWSREEIAGSLVVSRLSHRHGEYYFLFSSYEMNSWCVACPGVYRSMDYQYPKSWQEQERIFQRWAECLKRELDAPDPWAELAKYRLVLDGETPVNGINEPISAVEAEQIGQALTRLADRIARDLTQDTEQSLLVRAKFDVLAEAARRQRSQDWMYMALGVCTTMAKSLSLTEEQTVALWEAIRVELHEFIRLLPAKSPKEPRRSPIPMTGSASQGSDPAEIRELS